MKASEHLGKILERVNQTHWGKGDFVVSRGEHPTFCLLGLMHWTAVGDDAIRDFENEEELQFDLYNAHGYLQAVIDEEPLPEEINDGLDDGTWDDDIVSFNDSIVTTREDVARVVEKAMIRARESGD